jgi:peroxiredoxin
LSTARFCSRPLTDFQAYIVGDEAEQIWVIAGAMDSVGKTTEFAENPGLTFPIAWGMAVVKISGLTGAFCKKEKAYSNYQAYPRTT